MCVRKGGMVLIVIHILMINNSFIFLNVHPPQYEPGLFF